MKVVRHYSLWFFSCLSIICVATDYRFQVSSQLHGPIAWVREPVYQVVDMPTSVGHSLGERLATRDGLLKENARLKDESLIFQAALLKTRGLEKENRELLRLLHSASFLKQSYKRVRLLSVELDKTQKTIVLDAGLNEGVSTGDVVLDARGLVGIVKSAGSRHSVVMNIIDPQHALPVQIDGSGYRGIAEGSGASGQLVMTHLPLSVKIRQGDTVVTSGLGGRFPAGFPVGEVVAIETMSNNSFAQIFIQPYANLASLLDVVVVHTTVDTKAVEQASTPETVALLKTSTIEASASPSTLSSMDEWVNALERREAVTLASADTSTHAGGGL